MEITYGKKFILAHSAGNREVQDWVATCSEALMLLQHGLENIKESEWIQKRKDTEEARYFMTTHSQDD